MREFLYKNSFLRFFSALNYQKYRNNLELIPLAILVVVNIFVITFSNFYGVATGYGVLIITLSVMLYAVSAIFGVTSTKTPNLINVLPISHRKKTAWYLLSPFFAMIIAVIILFIVGLIFVGLGILIDVIAGNTIDEAYKLFIYTAESELLETPEIGLFGGIFSVLFILLNYGTGTVAGQLKNNLYRYLALSALVVVNAITFFSINAVTPDGFAEFYKCSPLVSECYTVLPNLWVVILIYGLLTAATIALSIYVTVKRFSPKKY